MFLLYVLELLLTAPPPHFVIVQIKKIKNKKEKFKVIGNSLTTSLNLVKQVDIKTL
jgi:hypothetical protein